MKKTLLSLVAILAFVGFANAQLPAKKGLWKFDNPDQIFMATIGNELLPSDVTNYPAPGPADGNGAIADDRGDGLVMDHGLGGNGGGVRLNEYTLQWDVMVPNITTWKCFIQTENAPSGGDGDLFIKAGSGLLGLSDFAWSTTAIVPEQWYRVVETIKCGSFARVYVDGQLWFERSVAPTIDSRYSLTALPLLFGDDDAEDDLIFCAELGLWDVALTADQVSQLGDVNTIQESIRDNKTSGNTSDLMPNYPNPVAHNTIFPYEVQKSGNVTFRVLDQTGKVIEVINAGAKTPGKYNLNYNSDKLSKGIYSVQMTSNNRTSIRKMAVIR